MLLHQAHGALTDLRGTFVLPVHSGSILSKIEATTKRRFRFTNDCHRPLKVPQKSLQSQIRVTKVLIELQAHKKMRFQLNDTIAPFETEKLIVEFYVHEQ